MSIGRAILSGLAGAARGGAKLALLEDEERRDMTKTTYRTGVAMAEKYGELREQSREEILAENNAVNQLKDYVIDGQPLGSANARALIRKAEVLGIDNPLEVLDVYAISGEARVEVKAPKKKRVVPEGLDLEKDDRGFFAQGRTKSVVSDAEKLLKGSGIDIEYEIPQKPVVDTSGLTFTKKDTIGDFSERTTYLFDEDRNPIKPLRTVTELKSDGTRVVKHYDITTGKEFTPQPNQILGESKSDFVNEQPWKEFGILAVLEDGKPTPTNQSAFRMKDGSIRLATPNGPADEVYTPEDKKQYVVVPPETVMEFGGINEYFQIRNEVAKSPIGKTLMSERIEVENKAIALESLENYSKIRKGLYDEFGDRMFGIVGVGADALSAISREVSTAYGVVTSFSETDWDNTYANKDEREKARFAYVESREAALRDLAGNKDKILSGIVDEAERISVARAIDKSLAILTAYDLAKATGDTRISDADFKAFLRTVQGTSSTKSVELIQTRMDTAISEYEASVKKVDNIADSYLGADAPEDSPVTKYVNDQRIQPGSERHPSAFRKRHKEMFGTNSYFKAASERVEVEDDIVTQKVKLENGKTVLRVNLDDGTSLDLTHPKYLDANDEEIKEAIRNIREAQGQ